MASLSCCDPEAIDVLYIHPALGKGDFNIPMGIISLMNSIPCSKYGVMAWELTPQLITSSRIAVMDLHWYFPLDIVKETAAVLKKINPEIKIIIGGYTASIFASIIVRDFKVDYVIVGDAEKPFRLLTEALLADEGPAGIDNIVSLTYMSDHSYAVTVEDYDNLDAVSVGWFPTFQKHMRDVQMKYPAGFKEDLGVYPFVPVLRGCLRNCPKCYSNTEIQQKMFSRSMVARSPEAIIKTLMQCEKDPGINTAHIIGDFLDLLSGDYAGQILQRKYSLNLTYDLFNLPSLHHIDAFLESFERVCFICHLYRDHGKAKCLEHEKKLFKFFSHTMVRNCEIKLFADLVRVSREELRSWLAPYPQVSLLDSSYWYEPAPYPAEAQYVERQFKHFYRLCRE